MMRKTVITLLLLIPVTSFAQTPQNMSKQDMQKMIEQMQKMQSCLQKIDQSKLNVFEKRSYQLEAEVNALCASGKRDDAQTKALSFSKDVMNDPTMQAMRKCSKMMEGKMPAMPFMGKHTKADKQHVCD